MSHPTDTAPTKLKKLGTCGREQQIDSPVQLRIMYLCTGSITLIQRFRIMNHDYGYKLQNRSKTYSI